MSPVRQGDQLSSTEGCTPGTRKEQVGLGECTKMAVLGLTSRLTSLSMFPGERMSHFVELDPMTSFRSKGWQVKITKQSGGEVRAIVSGYWLVASG